MTHTPIIRYSGLLLITFLMFGSTLAFASEVTGTLSSAATTTSTTSTSTGSGVSESIGGTVTETDSNSGGGSRSTGSGGISNTPTGSVLGATDDNPLAPGFPNAGNGTPEESGILEAWSTLVTFFKNLISL